MSKIQRFKYGAVRILHQENLDVTSISALRGRTLYERMAHAASSSSLQVRTKTPAQVQNRSSYWKSQARYLVLTITEGSSCESKESKAENSPVKEGACAKMGREPSSSSAASSSVDLIQVHEEASSASHSSDVSTMSTLATTAASSQPPATWSTDTLVASSLHSSSSSLIPSNGNLVSLSAGQKQTTDQLPMDRFTAIVDLIFDPNIVQLNYRRAIINCARYASASIDEVYLKTVSTQDPSNPIFHAHFLAEHSVSTGHNLTMISPTPRNANGPEPSPREQAMTGSIRSTTITPPKRLHNYFQVTLWERCLNDLISLYNRIQSRHVDEPSSKAQGYEAVVPSSPRASCSQEPTGPSASSSADIYPFCCKAHSLVFTTQYPFSIVPYSFRVHLRRMARKVQSVSQKSIWSNALGDPRERVPSRRRIQYTGPTNKLRFCDSATHGPAPTSPTVSKQNITEDDEDVIMERRFRIEERIRQDNLIKQELLALCHMACGLFLADDRSSNPPPTLMSLLRQGSPWNKGVWREGEWQHTPIDVVWQRSHSRSNSSSQEGLWAAVTSPGDNGSKADTKDMGRWQKLCVAAIQFLAHEDLAWGGNKTNAELSRLRAMSNATAWLYHE
ncbi:hypothetical protein BGZ65_011294 [Modicella reniformis]|uniref:Uncharacterized protein n=1 Tax=Modicella reniformis TaxID=1440133 RepID=A0A9P6MAM6_9FUNG|nr:hypothetical protein BGZ65_011294 [Modicella reniformis]